MTRLRLLLVLVPVAFFQVGCSNTDTSPTAGNVDADGNTVSSVPWNKPESWETDGQLGGMTGH
jgi:PBP1b-binding outer membrane lipoprotein LpoB